MYSNFLIFILSLAEVWNRCVGPSSVEGGGSGQLWDWRDGDHHNNNIVTGVCGWMPRVHGNRYLRFADRKRPRGAPKGRETSGLPRILFCIKSEGRLFPILNSRRKLVVAFTVWSCSSMSRVDEVTHNFFTS